MILAAAVLGWTLSAASSGSEEDLDALVEKIQRHYDTVEDFEAEFTQSYERRLLSRRIEESGKLFVKKPGRMRWEYQTPEEKLFITDGDRSYFFIPAEHQVMVSHHPEGPMGMEEGSPFELLVGKSRITDSFSFFPSDSEPARGGVVLHLIPMTALEGYQDVEIEVSPSDGRVLRVVLIDAQENRTEFVFANIRENVGLSEELFRFTVPADAEVVVQSPPRPDLP